MKIQYAVGLAALFTSIVRMTSMSNPMYPTPVLPTTASAGIVSIDGVIKFEDIKPLTPELKQALTLLRNGNYKEAEKTFLDVEAKQPAEALAYKGESEASYHLRTLPATIARYRKRLSQSEKDEAADKALLATLNYALGDAVMGESYYPQSEGENPRELGADAEKHLLTAIRLQPTLVVAHLALAAYYEHPSQSKGSKARRQYDEVFRLRPDLYQVRYLHAITWDRPGLSINEAELSARGIAVPEDYKKMPAKTIEECLTLTREYPSYPLPYLRLSRVYAWPVGDQEKAKQYLAIYQKLTGTQ